MLSIIVANNKPYSDERKNDYWADISQRIGKIAFSKY